MDIDMNNVYLNHKGYRISIAQHKNETSYGKTRVQEVMLWKDEQDKSVGWNDVIIPYSDTLEGLINALNEAKTTIEGVK